MKNSLKTLPLLLILLLALAAPAAFAQSGQDGYIEEGPSIVDRSSGNAPDDGSGGDDGNDVRDGSGSGELPFTGLDLGLLGLAGASLLLVGVGMRRVTRAHDSV